MDKAQFLAAMEGPCIEAAAEKFRDRELFRVEPVGREDGTNHLMWLVDSEKFAREAARAIGSKLMEGLEEEIYPAIHADSCPYDPDIMGGPTSEFCTCRATKRRRFRLTLPKE